MLQYRRLRTDEGHLLEEFLSLAIFQEDPANPLPRDVTQNPDLAVYIDAWGKPDDICVVAIDGAAPVGAAWTRIIAGEVRGYGNIDPHTPELSISVKPEHRGRGVGEHLLRHLFGLLRARGYARVSLSVQKANPALRLYRRLGFTEHADHGGECVMVLDL